MAAPLSSVMKPKIIPYSVTMLLDGSTVGTRQRKKNAINFKLIRRFKKRNVYPGTMFLRLKNVLSDMILC